MPLENLRPVGVMFRTFRLEREMLVRIQYWFILTVDAPD